MLALLGSLEKKNWAWRKLFHYGRWVFYFTSALTLILFGPLWPSRRILVLLGFLLTAGAVLLLLAAVMRRRLGSDSVWHKLCGEELTLGEDSLSFSARCSLPKMREGDPFVWKMLYRDIKRLEYDRARKLIRVVGTFDESYEKPALRDLPAPMRQDGKPSYNDALEIPLYFPEPEALLEELERRCGVFFHPARRADDMADLNYLPGLKSARVIRPTFAGVAAFCVLFSITFFLQGLWLDSHPYEPFPKTDEAMLNKTFSVGETAVLNGAEITLLSVNETFEVFFTLTNKTDADIMFDLSEGGNAAAYYEAGGELFSCAFTADEPLVRIVPGGVYVFSLCMSCDGNPEAFKFFINSADWPADKPFWREKYKGDEVVFYARM